MKRVALFAAIMIGLMPNSAPGYPDTYVPSHPDETIAAMNRLREQGRSPAAAGIVDRLIDGVLANIRRQAPMKDYNALFTTSVTRLSGLTARDRASVCVHLHAVMFVLDSHYLERLEEGACPVEGDTDECRFVDATDGQLSEFIPSALLEGYSAKHGYIGRIMRCGSFVIYRAILPPDSIGGGLDALLDRASKGVIRGWMGQ